MAQLGRYVMIHVGHSPIKHSQLFPILLFSLHNSPLWSTHPGQLGQGKTNRARTSAILDNKSMHECCWLRQRGQHWFSWEGGPSTRDRFSSYKWGLYRWNNYAVYFLKLTFSIRGWVVQTTRNCIEIQGCIIILFISSVYFPQSWSQG